MSCSGSKLESARAAENPLYLMIGLQPKDEPVSSDDWS
ncbi:hypothetical protein Q669_23405 [Labrenzia sp. C1B10]|nr:hypothetical protein Q669_23405 [Labrenzia sp. C1B10]ERS01940.1 hypothetical protein Q675_07520 [Labrenzia sp. C1B70]